MAARGWAVLGLGAGATAAAVVTVLLNELARSTAEIERYAEDIASSAGRLQANLEVEGVLGELARATQQVRDLVEGAPR